jgi:hypothetical protein
MANQADRAEGARAAAERVLAALPRAAESLDQLATGLEAADTTAFTVNVPGVEPVSLSVQSVEQLAEGFRDLVQTLEAESLADAPAASLDTADAVGVIESIENAATSIQSLVSSIEADSASADVDEVFKLGRLSGAAELIVGSLENSAAV